MRVVQIITAGGQGEQVQEREGHGLFTSYFLEAIAGEADLNKDNVVTGTELGAYLRPTVSNASRQAQTPLFGRLEGEGEFLFFVKGEPLLNNGTGFFIDGKLSSHIGFVENRALFFNGSKIWHTDLQGLGESSPRYTLNIFYRQKVSKDAGF